jgi:hypothetical protein
LNGRQVVTNVSSPSIQMRMIRITMSARIPRNNSPPGISDHRGKDIEGSGEIESPMDHREYRRVGVAPLIECESKTAAVD